MKRVLIVIIGVVVALVLLGAYLARPGKRILFTWNNSLNSLVPDCNATVTKRCISGFTLTDVTAGTAINSAIAPNAATFTYTPSGGIPIGYDHTFTLVTNGIDSSGVAVTSPPVSVTVTHRIWPDRAGSIAVIQY
jgi:hypothetical protein